MVSRKSAVRSCRSRIGNAALYDEYIASARKFAQAAANYGATAMFSNHTEFDNAYFKSQTALALRALHGDDNRHSNQFFVSVCTHIATPPRGRSLELVQRAQNGHFCPFTARS